MILLTVLGAGITAVLFLPTLSDLLSLLRLPFVSPRLRSAAPERSRLLVLVPAHNEELLLAQCLRSLRGSSYPDTHLRIVVVADNCSDGTADVARAERAEVLERNDATRRGKPFAIVWALEHLGRATYDAVVIVDADSLVDPSFASALATAGPLAAKAVQPYNDVSNRTENALTRMAAVFSAARFRFINVLKQRTRLNVPLGNGLCLGSRVLEEHGWNAFSICEDWELYADLTARGVPIECVPAAHIFSQEAKSVRQASTQRQRWTTGRLQVLARYAPKLLRSARISAAQKLDAIAELTAPGPAVHLGVAALGVVALVILQPPLWPMLTAMLTISILRLVVYTLGAIATSPQPVRTAFAFAYLPLYTVWRLGNQLISLASVRERRWIRTRRHAESRGDAR